MTKTINLNGIKNSFNTTICKLVLFTALSFSFACGSTEIADSKDVNQSKIHQYYSISYDASEGNEYDIFAQFRFGGNKGTTLKLSEPSQISVNDIKMKEEQSSFRGCFYKLAIKDSNTFNFKFTDTENKIYSNSVVVNSIEIVKVEKLYAEKNQKIYWQGKSLENKEEVIAIIEDNDNNKVEVSTDIIGSNYISLNAEDMENLVAGSGQIYMIRKYYSSLQEVADDGGSVDTEYISMKMPIEIISNKTKSDKDKEDEEASKDSVVDIDNENNEDNEN